MVRERAKNAEFEGWPQGMAGRGRFGFNLIKKRGARLRSSGLHHVDGCNLARKKTLRPVNLRQIHFN